MLGLAGKLAGHGSEVTEPNVIPIWPDGVPGAAPVPRPERVEQGRVFDVQNPSLLHYAPVQHLAGDAAIAILPGGGYKRLALEKEGVAAARWLNSLGLHAFVVKYRVGNASHPAQLQDAEQSVRVIRSLSTRIKVRTDRVGLLGFSAGGHLAALVATEKCSEIQDTTRIGTRPDLLILVYPVITMVGPFAHLPSRDTLIGPEASECLARTLSAEQRVSTLTPPSILFHAIDDAAVPFENSLEFHRALGRVGVPCQLRLLESGGHGFGLGAHRGDWPAQCAEWLREEGWLRKPLPGQQ